MEVEESTSLDILSSDTLNDVQTVLPLVQKCIKTSEKENEIIRAVELSFNFCLRFIPVDSLENDLFRDACPAGEKIFLCKINILDNFEINLETEKVLEIFNICQKIISDFHEVYMYLEKEIREITVLQVDNLLRSSACILYSCFSHCKNSEKIYGSRLSSFAESLANLFKKCTNLLDDLLNFLLEKLAYGDEAEEEGIILSKVLSYLSKCGIILINVEMKTMAKLWKSYATIVQKLFSLIKDEYNIGETINILCSVIESNVDMSFGVESIEVNKSAKLACFILKLVIKLCEIFKGYLKDCHNSLLNLILKLTRHKAVSEKEIKPGKNFPSDLIGQMLTGTDPLLVQLISDIEFVKGCLSWREELNEKNVVELSIFNCSVMKNLMHSDKDTRKLWFNEEDNILHSIFKCASYGQFHTSQYIHLPNIIITGFPKNFTDLYEYVLVTTSAYLMTMPAVDFHLVEKILIENVLQLNMTRALLAIDIWCLLARFADSSLCFTQIQNLANLYQNLNCESVKIEKLYLKSLIHRLIPLLTQSQRESFFKLFPPLLYSNLWEGDGTFSEINGYSLNEGYFINKSIMMKMNPFLTEEEPMNEVEAEILGQEGIIMKELERKIMKLWNFECSVLLSTSQSAEFLKLTIGLTAYIIPEMSSHNLLKVLCQVKKLLSFNPQLSIQLYTTWILNSLSTVRIPNDNLQKNIISSIADVFRCLLSSNVCLVKQKTFEIFYTFSHVTSHSNVIALSVQNSPLLKIEITNYFKKNSHKSLDFDLNDYFNELISVKYKRNICSGIDEVRVNKIEKNSNIEEIVERWKRDGEEIKNFCGLLTELQKEKIKQMIKGILLEIH